ncbi:hypothetical protein [Pseudomonas fluorescens]|nr:hypothetical protein [Pseudomonas fluorescens]
MKKPGFSDEVGLFQFEQRADKGEDQKSKDRSLRQLLHKANIIG